MPSSPLFQFSCSKKIPEKGNLFYFIVNFSLNLRFFLRYWIGRKRILQSSHANYRQLSKIRQKGWRRDDKSGRFWIDWYEKREIEKCLHWCGWKIFRIGIFCTFCDGLRVFCLELQAKISIFFLQTYS